MTLIPNQRHLFDIPNDVAYFNCSYNSPLLVKSGKVLVDGALSKCQPWGRKPNHFFDDAEQFRVAAARAFGGTTDNYAVVPSVPQYERSQSDGVMSVTAPRSNKAYRQQNGFQMNGIR